jgi:hypothetical protein
MPPGPLTIAADVDNASLLAALAHRLETDEPAVGTPVDLLLTSRPPEQPAHHIAFTNELTDDVDAWDQAAPPQTVAGALWIPAGCDATESVVAWLALRRQTPTTPLSDLTDANGRALRWSIASAADIALPSLAAADVDEAEVRAWLDEQPQVQELGSAVNRIGGDTADVVLSSADRFREAMRGLHELADIPTAPDFHEFEGALAEHLRQVQVSGLRRWRSGRARAQSQDSLCACARNIAAERLRTLIDVRLGVVAQQRESQVAQQAQGAIVELLQECVLDLDLPASVDFTKVPRSWPGEPPPPRRYVLLHPDEQAASIQIEGATVRTSESVPAHHAMCMIIQSGFSLPGLR